MSNGNGSRSPADLQLELVHQIIEAGCVVQVGEHEIRLTPPARSKIAHLHQRPKDKDEMTPEENETFSMHNTAVESVKACIPGLAVHEAEQFVALSGGDNGELAEKAMELCGFEYVVDYTRNKIDEVIQGVDSGSQVDPTSA